MFSWKQHEKAIKEKRHIEANQKLLTGVSGKLANIAKNFGTDIIRHNSDSGNELLYDIYQDIYGEKQTIKTLDEDDYVETIGKHYSGLGNGINLEIIFMYENKKISVYYNGNLVYKEEDGELYCYVPNEKWESYIHRMHEKILERNRTIKKTEKEIKKIQLKRLKNQFVEKMKRLWGI